MGMNQDNYSVYTHLKGRGLALSYPSEKISLLKKFSPDWIDLLSRQAK